jgi:N utilization substance protein B
LIFWINYYHPDIIAKEEREQFMSRRKAREAALQALFQLDFHQIHREDALQAVFCERTDMQGQAKDYAQILVEGALCHLVDIDSIIAGATTDWKIERMPGVDRNILRLAIYELKYGTEPLSPNVVINEAVELAKTFGTEESGRFVNGILGSLVKSRPET